MPLEAFRVFDAAARHMNFSAAGRELSISQAAVSRRIAQLEDRLAAPLFIRAGRHVALTAEGARLAGQVRGVLEYLEDAISPFARRPAGGAVTISASGSVSHLWLADRVRRFGEAMPEIAVRVFTTDDLDQLAGEGNDLGVLYSRGAHPRWDLELLLEEVLVPVAAPAYLERIGCEGQMLDARTLHGLSLLDYERYNAHWISLDRWFRTVAPDLPPIAPRRRYTGYVLTIEGALRGEGVALGSKGLIADHLAAGRLVPISRDEVRTEYGYYLARPRDRDLSPEAAHLYEALRGGGDRLAGLRA
ncbi:MAG: LysR substrate-binding domain-containing protein [Pseudomonadota bacterium]